MPVIYPFNTFRAGEVTQKSDTELASEFTTTDVDQIYTQGGLCMWGNQPPDRGSKVWLEVTVDIFFGPLLYNISVNINSVTVTTLCYSNNIIKYNSIEREYKDYFEKKKALHLSTSAQSTGHPCLMYLIRFMTIYDCFYIVKTYCTFQFSFQPLQGP